jgi:hypothetical protein
VECWRCREPIPPGAKWDLGHVEGGGRHPEHLKCNRAAGARTRKEEYVLVPRSEAARTAAVRDGSPRFPDWPGDDPQPGNVVPRWSRHWGGPANPRCPRCAKLRGPCPDADTADRGD